MAKNPESGHTKNVSNFHSLLSFVKGYGNAYNPARDALKIPALEEILTNSQNALVEIDTLSPVYTNAVSARKTAFISLNKIVTRVNNAIKATDTTTQVDDTVKTLIRKLLGTRASTKISDEVKKQLEAEGKEVNQISASQMGYDNRLENLFKLIKLLSAIPQYTPNEEDLKISSLTARYEDLKTKNMAVVDSYTVLSNARISRNIVMYNPLTGLVDIALDTKTYVKSVFGASDSRYKQLTKLVFRSPKR